MNILIHLFQGFYFYRAYSWNLEFLGQMCNILNLIILTNCLLKMLPRFIFLPSMRMNPLPYPPCITCLLNFCLSGRLKKNGISFLKHLYLPNQWWSWTSFHMFFSHLYFSFITCKFFSSVAFLLICESSLYDRAVTPFFYIL